MAVALFVLAVSGGGAYWLAGRISSDIGSATLGAEELARGKPVQTTPSIVSDVARLGHALERSSTLLMDRSAERDRHSPRRRRHAPRPSRRTVRRTSSWGCSVTNCAIRCRRLSPRWPC